MKNWWSLVAISMMALLLRLNNLNSSPHFSDMDWFSNSARMALATQRLPLLGITASITWLHQGPLWTYLLLLPTAINLSPLWLTIAGGVAVVVIAYFASGRLAALALAMLPFAITQAQTAYHTSLIPVFFFIAYLSLVRSKWFLSGLFLGFLYQLHLLTFIYWPLFIYLLIKKQGKSKQFGFGFILGILPFILAGPLQLGGIFIWMVKQLVTGFGGVGSGISTAYWVVLLPLAILLLGGVIKWLHAYRRGFGSK